VPQVGLQQVALARVGGDREHPLDGLVLLRDVQ